MSSACSTRSAVAPAVIAIGNITEPVPITRRPPLPLRSVSPIAEWPRPSRCPSSCSATDSRSTRSAWPFGATEKAKLAVEEDVRFVDRAGGRVDHEAGRAEHAIEIGTIDEADRRSCRRCLPPAPTSCPGYANRTVADSTPDHVAVARCDARHADPSAVTPFAVAIGNEIADRLLLPGRVDDVAVEHRAELQIRQRR